MKKRILKVAFVGCGGIASQYLAVYRKLDFAKVTWCIDTDPERGRSAARAIGDGAQYSDSLERALGSDVDVVVINTPNHLHRDQAVTALEHEKHVLLQKPIAPTLEDGELILAAAGRAARLGISCGLYMSYLDQPLVHDFREMIRCGWFGDVVHLYARLMHRGGIQLSEEVKARAPNWRTSIEKTGGGCFIQLAAHFIHLFTWLTGNRVNRVMAMSKNLACPGIEGEDIACALLEFSNGSLATIDTAWNTAGEQLGIQGTLGSAGYFGNRDLVLESTAGIFKGQVVRFENIVGQTKPAEPGSAGAGQRLTVTAPRLDDVGNPFNQHVSFLQAILTGSQPEVSASDGLEALSVVNAVYQSARAGLSVNLVG